MKRYRRRKSKSGQLQAYYGRLDGDDPDLIFSNGDGVPRCDRAYLCHALGMARYAFNGEREPSVWEELIARGYDPDTFRFSIMKKDDE